MQVIFNEDEKKLGQLAAHWLEKEINDLLSRQDQLTLAIPGGRSIEYLFGEMLKLKVDWHRVHFFWLDERLVLADHPENNFLLARNLFLDKALSEKILTEDNLHPFIVNDKDPETALNNYDKILRQYGGKYDIIIAGVGEDGHVGALFPYHPALRSIDNFVYVHDAPKLPAGRMTSGSILIKKAQTAFLFFVSLTKKKAYQNFLDEEVDKQTCPAEIFKNIPNLYLITNLKK